MLNKLIRINNNSKNERNDAKIFPLPEFKLNFDGASKGNPGLSGAGMVIYKNEEEIWSSHKFIGCKTNNQAEYSALIFGLEGALNLGIKTLSVFGDSLLVINQINGLYKVKSDFLLPLHKEALALKSKFDYIEFNHVYRDNNKRADELSNMAFENMDKDLSLTEDLGIQELDEDWCEEKLLPVKIANSIKSGTLVDKKYQQTSITDFLLKGSLFPDI
jgi:ribonuclease HI